MTAKTEHSKKFTMVKKWYDTTPPMLTKEQVHDLVTHPESNPMITADEYEEITGDPYVA